MKRFEVSFRPEVHGDLAALDDTVRRRLFAKLKWLSEHMDAVRPEPLHAHLQGFYKLRVGDYRVIYRLDQQHQRLTVYFAGHRRNIYKLTARSK